MSAALESERSPVRRFGVAVICAKVALVPLVFHQAFDFPFTVPKALLSHSLAYLLGAILIALAVRHGWAFLVRSWLHLPVLTFLAANVVATAFAADRTLALYGTHARMLGLGTIADWVILYFAVVHLVRTRREAVAVITSGLGAALASVAYAFAQIARADPFRWDFDTASRAFGTIGQSTVLAEYLTTVGIGALALAVTPGRLGLRQRVMLAAASAVLIAGVATTGTRSALIGLAAGTMVLVILSLLQGDPRARVLRAGGATFAAAGLVLFLLFGPFGGRLAATFAPSDASEESVLERLELSANVRFELYGIALRMLAERPVAGYGPDNFVVGVPEHRPPAANVEVRQSLATSAHSWIAQVAATSGVLGLASFAAIALVATALVFRSRSQPVPIAALAMLAAFLGTGLTTVSDIGADWLFWVAAAAIAAATAPTSAPAEPAAPARRRGRARARMRPSSSTPLARAGVPLALAAGVALASISFGAADASRLAEASEEARLRGSSPDALASGLAATRADPGRAQYWHILGLAYVSAARWREASDAFGTAQALAPYDVRHLNDRASALLPLAVGGDAGARALALALGDEAVRIDPNNPRAHLTRVVVRQAAGDVAEALRSAERALELDPGSINARLYGVTVQLMVASGRVTEAVALARIAVRVFDGSLQSVPLRIELARALVAAGQLREALAVLDEALAIAPNERTAAQLRTEIRTRLQ